MLGTEFDMDKALDELSDQGTDGEMHPSLASALTTVRSQKGERTLTAEGVRAETWPSLPLKVLPEEQQALSRRMTSLTAISRSYKDYAVVRDEFVMTSFALNQLGLLAPAFRDQPSIPAKAKDWTASHLRLLIDRIVIDCHWLYCRKETVEPRWNELHEIFSPGAPFDCLAIEGRLARRKWGAQFRAADLLLLTDRQQMELRQLRTGERRKAHAAIFDGSSNFDHVAGKSKRTSARIVPVRLAINNWAERVHQVRDQKSVYQALWVARELLGPAATHRQIAELAGLQCGCKPLQPRTAADKLKVLDRVVATAGVR